MNKWHKEAFNYRPTAQDKENTKGNFADMMTTKKRQEASFLIVIFFAFI
jgi:hypothetical protein